MQGSVDEGKEVRSAGGVAENDKSGMHKEASSVDARGKVPSGFENTYVREFSPCKRKRESTREWERVQQRERGKGTDLVSHDSLHT
jgi:hypothetical protein